MVQSPADLARLKHLAETCIAQLQLSLEGLAVYTEAASGAYLFAPILAAMAGARRVYAVTRDSSYGRAAEVEAATLTAARTAGVADRILVTDSKTAEHVGDSDIITNSGFVRPIDATMIAWMKPTAVVPLMWETWEFRGSDLDLAACREHGILVMGTDEGKPPFPMYSYVGLLALKLLFELGLEGLRTKVLVLGGGRMGEAIVDVLSRCGVEVTGVAGDDAYDALAKRWRGEGYDAVICAEHENPRVLIGEGGVLTADDLVNARSKLRVGVISGNVQRDALVAAGVQFYPSTVQPFGFMSYQPYSLGPRPVLELFASGLKVGWAMASARRRGLDMTAAQRFALETSPAMAFREGSTG
jgi:hypothetical protein